MKHWHLLSGTAGILIAAGATTAQADVSSADVWAAWQSMATQMGETLSAGSETQDGGTLTVTDMTVAMETTDASATATISEVVFSENGDGTVSITMAPTYDVMVNITPEEGGETVEMALTFSYDGLDMTASGDPDAVNYDFSAASIAIEVGDLVVDGEAVELDADVTLSDVAGVYRTDADATAVSTLTAATMSLVAHMDEPEGGEGTFDITADLADLSMESEGSVALMAGGVKELSTALAAGQSSMTTITHGAGTYDIVMDNEDDSFNLSGAAESGSLSVGLSSEALTYDVSNTGIDMTLSGAQIPLPEVVVTMAEMGFALTTPVSKSEEPQDFAFALTLNELGVSEMIWGLIDPSGTLPHDPATLRLDLSGKANFLFDLFDPESMEMVDDEMPAEIHELDVNELKLEVAGADLTGNGGFTFDMNDLETFDGIPAPTGRLYLQLVGANALLDNLVAMGLLPQDQAMGARMMMGLFARPGEGEDSLVSEIEIDGATGAISANGQRLQ
ncbi:DUF2125 domain-containing protein [Psychromarinibacter halotolerans]|uniref:DUF2125 domain-containing protein n=1 Tax=Psychromarinibacter halotolerans TaxID=1775175 RepID=A0ABV7GK61_9RHOB|nr:DUF2125 domain-containing protein [Psychromarinibacter halotolerans]MDF0595580.1 DUF2125 domain-containing protein [Psychromarinibacter halotolerans]